MHRLDLVVGPNGAGKSTFVRLTLAPLLPGVLFVNADDIARQRWPTDAESHAYQAADIAHRTRQRLLAERQSFIAETVFSHPSKLELITAAHALGYTVVLHALLVPEQLAVHRVTARVQAGGHTVPEDKIRSRFHRLWPLVADAISLVDEATVYDNSRIGGPRPVAQFSGGFVVGALDWPPWTPSALAERWNDAAF